MKETVVIGMSGGVDSSVAALLLKEAGYNVIGLFMRNWDSSINNDIKGNPDIDEPICTQEQDYNDALKVCEQLDIPLHRVDFIKEYWDHVFSYFLEELKKGRTPNPDILCNKYIKFDLFIKHAQTLGAKYVATGHYAKVADGKLFKAVDHNKDQTYFLSQVSNEQLQNVLFPLGDLDKGKVRELAIKHNLYTAKKKDSTGICFIGERHFQHFLENYLPNQVGNIIDLDTNEVVGEHYGLMYYTIGQRKGLNIGGAADKYFVVGKNLKDNNLYVALGSNNKYLYSNGAVLEDLNFLGEVPTNLKAKFRYRAKDVDVKLEKLDNDLYYVSYDDLKSVTPGQACVFYLNDECLGGGTIKEVRYDNVKLPYLL